MGLKLGLPPSAVLGLVRYTTEPKAQAALVLQYCQIDLVSTPTTHHLPLPVWLDRYWVE
jgi:hypothetical protein